jgi:8-oxo-dGTP pyrophosphatase MutT (NUDIX family)
MKADIDKAGLLVVREGRVLLCRKTRGTPLLILPGGKRDTGETYLECPHRELREELGGLAVSGLDHLGTYTDRAAIEDPTIVKTIRIELYRGDLDGTPVASSEIGELVWFGADGDRAQLAPSLANTILPDLIARGIPTWDGRHET